MENRLSEKQEQSVDKSLFWLSTANPNIRVADFEKEKENTRHDLDLLGLGGLEKLVTESKHPKFLSSMALIDLIRRHSDIPYYNQEGVRSIALDILTGPLNSNGYFTQNLLRELDYYDYLSLQGDEIAGYLDEDDFEGLLAFIPPGFSFELVTQVDSLYPELIDHTSVALPHDTLIKIAAKITSSSEAAFQESFSLCTYLHTAHNNAMSWLHNYDLFSHLLKYSERIHPTTDPKNLENSIGFRLNCTYKALSDKVGAVFSPHGEFLFCLKQKEGLQKNEEHIWLYNSFHGLCSASTSPALNTATCLVTHYNTVPESFQKTIRDTFAKTQHAGYVAHRKQSHNTQYAPKIDFEQLVNGNMAFDQTQEIINSLGLEHEIEQSTIDAFQEYLFSEIDTLEKNNATVEEITASDIQTYIREEYGLHDISKEEISEILSHLSFFSISELESLLGNTLESFKEKEVFAILTLLQQSEKGLGIAFLKEFLQNCDTAQERKVYIQVFGLKKFGLDPLILKQLKENLSEADYQQVLGYIQESYESIFSVESFLRDTFPSKGNNYLTQQIKRDLLHRLKKSFERIQELSDKETLQFIQAEAMNTTNHNILFLETFKTLRKIDQGLQLEDIVHSQFQTMIPAQDIDTETRAQMIAMYAKNHENESGAEALVEKFKVGFENEDRRLYTFSYKGTLLSFIAFDAKGDHALFASAFNVAPDARGYKIGEAMMDQALNEQAKENALTADCVATLPISAKYIESGFLGTHFYMDGTDPVLDIVRNDSILQTLTTRSLSPQEILTLTLMRPIQKNIEMYTATSQKEISFEPLSRGFVLTRYLVDKNTSRAHVVFEKPTVDITQWAEPQPISDRKAA